MSLSLREEMLFFLGELEKLRFPQLAVSYEGTQCCYKETMINEILCKRYKLFNKISNEEETINE